MQNRTKTVAAIIAFSGITAAYANAQYTAVNAPPGSESGHAAILSSIYGGSWAASGVDVTNGVSAATRLMDAGAPSGMGGVGLPVFAPALVQDDSWSGAGQAVTITAKAKYAGNSHIFGWFDDTQPDAVFQPIVSTSDFNNPVTVELSANFRWALHNTSTDRIFTSLPMNNSGVGASSEQTFDQLVTYHVTNSSGLSEIALFWEDRIGGESADYDYNDAVIAMAVAPAPGTGLLAGLGLLGLAGRRRR
jgi:hypothetical protein